VQHPAMRYLHEKWISCASDLIPSSNTRLGEHSRYLHPGDAPQMSERPRKGFRLPCRGLSLADALALAGRSPAAHACVMFSVDETTAEAIRQVFEESGELSAAVELRRHFLGITDNAIARLCVRAIASWTPLPPPPPKPSQARRTRSSSH
jgi:hypothetical protein